MMSRLDDLKKDVANMSQEQLLELVRNIRKDRKVSKHVQRKVPMKKRAAGKSAVKALFAGLNPEEKAALLKKLGG